MEAARPGATSTLPTEMPPPRGRRNGANGDRDRCGGVSGTGVDYASDIDDAHDHVTEGEGVGGTIGGGKVARLATETGGVACGIGVATLLEWLATLPPRRARAQKLDALAARLGAMELTPATDPTSLASSWLNAESAITTEAG